MSPFPVVLLLGLLTLTGPPSLAAGADRPQLKFPDLVAPNPQPVPSPANPTDTAYRINPEEALVIESETECFVRSFPSGKLTVQREAGPITIRSKFYGGNGKFESRKFTAPVVYVLSDPKVIDVEVVFVPKGVDSDDKIKQLTVGMTGPRPPPGPVPPDPAPKPNGDLGLRKASRDGAGLVTSPNKPAELKALAGANRSLASKIVAVQGFDPASYLDDWRKGNREAVGANEANPGNTVAWSPWASATSSKLQALHAAGKVPTKQDWAKAFTEIADGLEDATSGN